MSHPMLWHIQWRKNGTLIGRFFWNLWSQGMRVSACAVDHILDSAFVSIVNAWLNSMDSQPTESCERCEFRWSCAQRKRERVGMTKETRTIFFFNVHVLFQKLNASIYHCQRSHQSTRRQFQAGVFNRFFQSWASYQPWVSLSPRQPSDRGVTRSRLMGLCELR